MEKDRIIKALEELQKEKKRNFSQSYDLIITLRDIDIKTKPIESFIIMPHSRGKKVKICAFVGQELAEQAEKNFDLVVREKNFDEYKEKKKTKMLAKEYDFFIAQATLMPQVAAVFGRSLGPKGKMPNPKAGCVVPPNANLTVLKERLQKMVQVKAKNAPMIQCIVGNENMKQEETVENVLTLLTQVAKSLPNEEQNIHTVYLKKTMSKVVKV